MNISDVHSFIENLLQRDQLPTFMTGVLFGIILVLMIFRVVRWPRTTGLVRELREQNAQLKAANQGFKEEIEGAQNVIPGLERERELLRDKLKTQEGTIETLQQQKMETSAVCERLTTDNFELRVRLKRDKKALREIQKVAEGYSAQLDDATNSDGKIWLKPTNGQEVPFLPLGVRRAAIISLANLKGGVGKTTLAANIGAALANEGLRVLLDVNGRRKT